MIFHTLTHQCHDINYINTRQLAHHDCSHLVPNSDFTATILSNALLTDLVRAVFIQGTVEIYSGEQDIESS